MGNFFDGQPKSVQARPLPAIGALLGPEYHPVESPVPEAVHQRGPCHEIVPAVAVPARCRARSLHHLNRRETLSPRRLTSLMNNAAKVTAHATGHTAFLTAFQKDTPAQHCFRCRSCALCAVLYGNPPLILPPVAAMGYLTMSINPRDLTETTMSPSTTFAPLVHSGGSTRFTALPEKSIPLVSA